MRKPVVAVLIAAGLSAALAACSGSGPASNLACDTIVDAADNQTATQVITDLDAMMLTDHATNIPVGSGSNDAPLLDAAASALGGYAGGQLAADAEQFADDEQGHATASALANDITALSGECNTQQSAEQQAGLSP